MKKVFITLLCVSGLSGAAQAITLSDDSLSVDAAALVTQDLKRADQLYNEGKIIYARPLYHKHVPALSPVQKVRLASSLIWGDSEKEEVDFAATLLQEQYAAGNMAAAPFLGILHYRGKSVSLDSLKGVDMIRSAMAAGDAWGYYMYGTILVAKKDERAKENFEKAYDKGLPDAATAIGLIYEGGYPGKPDYSKALNWYKKGAKKGSGSCYARMGWLHYSGNEEDKKQAFLDFKMSEEYGDYRHSAELGLGHCYSFGEGVKENIDSALYYYRQAGSYGHARGYSRIGYMYEKGRGLKPLADSALYNYARGADLGDAWACFRMASVFSEGLLVPQNYALALKALQAGADMEDEDCMLELARYYRKGLGTDPDLDKSRQILEMPGLKESGAALYQLALIEDSLGHEGQYAALMKQAMDKGSGEAMFRRAQMFKPDLKDPDQKKLYNDYLLAAVKAGNAEAMFALGHEFCYGINREANLNLGKDLILQAARMGSRNALDYVGIYQKSFGAAGAQLLPKRSAESDEKDYTSDYQPPESGIATRAMEGDPEGQFLMAMKYIDGVGVRKNLSLAIQWLQQAAAQGHASSYFQLGYMYETGLGFQQSYADALTWYELAAAKDVPIAINNIGAIYSEGKGVPVDKEKAVTYYQKAAALGNTLAMANLGYYYVYAAPAGLKQPQLGAELITKSASAGEPNGEYYLGCILIDGAAGEQDIVRGELWLRKAAGHGQVEAMMALARRSYRSNPNSVESCDLFARYVAKTKEALTLVWLYDICGRKDALPKEEEEQLLQKLLANKGNLGKRDVIALLEFYRLGIGTEPDINKAIALGREMEAARENAEVELELARLYTRKPQPDYDEAARWCAKAVAKKGQDAVFDMGEYYGAGKHMTINDSLIYYYFKTEVVKGES